MSNRRKSKSFNIVDSIKIPEALGFLSGAEDSSLRNSEQKV